MRHLEIILLLEIGHYNGIQDTPVLTKPGRMGVVAARRG